MDEIRIVNYSLITLLMITFMAFVYTCHLVYSNSNFDESGSKIVAGFKA